MALALVEVQAQPERELRRAGDRTRTADLRCDSAQHAEDVLWCGAVGAGVGPLPRVRRRRRVEGDERGDLDEREGPGVQTRGGEMGLAQPDGFGQRVEVS